MSILVTGATGNTGRHVVAELLRRGHSVRALTRDPERAAAVLPAGADVVTGSHTEPDTLDAVLAGVTGLHITVTSGVAATGPELVRRAVAAGVERITILWGGHVGPAETAVAESGVAWTRLEPQEFMCNTLGWADSIRAAGVVREPFDFPSAVVHEADLGAVAAMALTEDGHAGRAYNLSGPRALTVRQRVAMLAEAIGREITFEQMTRQQAIDRLTATGVSLADAEYVVGWHADPPASARTPDGVLEQVLGRPPRTFEEWLTEHKDRF
ncbi:NmrA family NAD(P)-binding protein [Nocardia cyriacigeorgica]|uniref:NmrA family NAD(P)-binding protein n=1 Tax=Nocardia cyriacigeorgica TaxID=135487 RepID=UPI001895B191|nr:NmrA family NAD(P)-binding protein [Nocardia cyriacigeorgica]MBF6316861.1 NmrA family NAD(P)-binding protein [Nocardia cyriacigeorgica]MBF6416790.1 NmrA family NAD(P)-binding protein [Nocardia cyriacigeorgica]MBF6513840.1 NmrA family NAD(P)-binding protein [Nocardia cyriacigeorgica]MBF6532587.1 NmrA family NAD(P)-binding protein [Nocardia cyriacigeorgica]